MKKMKNKKGFTLIELLAVIVVLAIVLIIAVPRVLRVIEDSEKESFRITGENLLKGVKDKALIDSMTGVPSKTYTIEDGAFVDESISISGKMPNEGTIEVFSDGKIGLMIKDDKYCAIKEVTDTKVRLEPLEECVLNIPEEVPQSCFTYTKTSSAVTITGYDNACSKNLIIPDTIDNLPVKIIDHNVFKNKNLTSLILSNNLKTINTFAFAGNKLKSISIPKNVTNIAVTAFNNNLLPDDQAFIYRRNSDGSENKIRLISYGGVKKENVVIPNNVIVIENDAFNATKLKSITIPDSVTTIGSYAFVNNQLTSIKIPSGVTNIYAGTFLNNHLTSITIPSNVTIQTNSISQTFYDAYNPTKAGGTYTASSQTGTWTKQ